MKIEDSYLEKIKEEILTIIEPGIYYCYQCGKCTAGCPISYVYEYQPNEIIRLIQLNKINVIFNSNSIYLCTSCEICSSRCPQNVNIAAIMNYLRIKSWHYKRFKLKRIYNFYKIFLKIIEKFGRSFEPLLIICLNFLNKTFFNDFDSALKILKKRKIKIIPELLKNRKEVSFIIKKYS
ncbi:MAG: 4Fe-4S dicluster domain-containing protein [Actinobacteria bacterium]|nr:4Fe-4S dicluster domain-containing protein [Cyanobacteriota bacterium]MCL5771544.1 4Fe-4S dicluster domain-containing protein [Actinomycetota bacterium]